MPLPTNATCVKCAVRGECGWKGRGLRVAHMLANALRGGIQLEK
jgi:hypothetical protein